MASDADWANDRGDRKSMSGYVVYLFGNVISWCAKKQSVVAKSSTAAEYIAADLAVEEALWIQSLLQELTCNLYDVNRVTTWIDNTSTISRIKKQATSNTQKTIDVKFHAIKDEWRKGSIDLVYCETANNPADLFTKALTRSGLEHKRALCRVLEPSP